MATITETTMQDMPRNHERGTDPEQARIACLCEDFNFGLSKASRLVRKYKADCKALSLDPDDAELYIVWLQEAMLLVVDRGTRAVKTLMHSDPTGEAACRAVMYGKNGDPRGERARAAWAAQYGAVQEKRGRIPRGRDADVDRLSAAFA